MMKLHKAFLTFLIPVSFMFPSEAGFAQETVSRTRHLRHYDSVFVEVDMHNGNISRGWLASPLNESELKAQVLNRLQRAGIPVTSQGNGSNVVRLHTIVTHSPNSGLYACQVDGDLNLNVRGDKVILSVYNGLGFGVAPNSLAYGVTISCLEEIEKFIQRWQESR